MKKLFIAIVICIVFLCGCQTNRQAIKQALGDALTVGAEVEQIEREQGDIETADRIAVWLKAGQNIYDTGSITDNCDLMLSVTGIAYDWIAKEYPDKAEYRIPIALLRSRLLTICEVGK